MGRVVAAVLAVTVAGVGTLVAVGRSPDPATTIEAPTPAPGTYDPDQPLWCMVDLDCILHELDAMGRYRRLT